MTKAKVAVLISGAGTNMAALLYAAKADGCPYELALVASNNPEAPGLAIAAAEGIATWSLSHHGMTRDAFDTLVDEQLRAAGADYVALAGYMRILSEDFVARWAGKMLNIHPSLLPKYKGLNTHQQAIDAGDTHGGCSVHVVTAALDDGPVLAQTKVAIVPGDTAESLTERVRFAEHQLYPVTLAAFVARERSPDYLLGRVRDLAMALPEADEVTSHGMPCFGIVKGKKFAYFTQDHHGDGKTALLVKISGADEQAQLIELDEDRYYRPAYFGDGWVGIRLDLGDTDWDAIGEWLRKSWLVAMPAETQLSILSLILSGAFDRLPRNLRICFGHGGGSFAFLLGRVENAWKYRDIVRVDCPNPPSSYVDRFFVDSAVFDPRALTLLVEVMGEDRILLGSDHPFPLGEQDIGALVREHDGLSGAQKAKILSGNSRTFLNL